ncbi:hypothetical protein V1511DRAFT_498493 [Dipodascopsis uninucleata]
MEFIPMFFVCGGTNFNKPLSGYEGMNLYCPRCHNISVIVIKKREFFTFCFVPIIPTAFGEALQCTICPYTQPITQQQLSQIQGMNMQNQGAYQQNLAYQRSQQYEQQHQQELGLGPGAKAEQGRYQYH